MTDTLPRAGMTPHYNLRLPNGDSMVALIDDELGLFVIREYDGTWGFRWNPECLGGGQTMHEFVRTSNADYLAGKMVPADRWHTTDEEATYQAHLRKLESLCLDDDDEKFLRWQIEDVGDWDEVAQGKVPSPLAKHCDEVWDLMKSSDSRYLIQVRDVCIPAVQAYLKQLAAEETRSAS